MLEKFTAWLLDIIIRIFKTIADVFMDIGIAMAEAVFGALAAIIAAVPAPAFLSSNSLGSLLNQLPSDVLYFVSTLRITEALAVVGLGFAFRMTRKLVTLGQW